MSATFRIITHHVGEGGRKAGIDVLRIQQLLQLNGYKIRADHLWHTETTDALVAFQKKIANPTEAYMMGSVQSPQTSLHPHDSLLFELAYRANVLIRLSPGGDIYRRGIAFEDVHKGCEDQDIKFDMRTRIVWGLDKYLTWAIVTKNNDEFNTGDFETSAPLALNCTLYANLMMSVWKQGNAHHYPFSAGVKTAGGNTHFANDRYGYPIAGQFSDASEIRALTAKHPHSLFCLEFGSDWVGHLALFYRGRVYECNVGPTADVHSVTLDHWVASHPFGWVLGPAPN